jgi:hypothetical protein
MSSTPPLFPDFPRQPIRKISPYIPSILITTDGQELVYREYAVNANGRIITRYNGMEYPIIQRALPLHSVAGDLKSVLSTGNPGKL